MKRHLLGISTTLLCCLLGVAHADTQTIAIGKLKAAPQVDGSADDWKDIAGTKPPLTYLGKPELTKTVTLKAGVFGDEVFYSKWEDSTEDTQHKPHVWDETQQKYVEGPQREDRFALEFAMESSYKATLPDGATPYIQRPTDAGEEPYKANRYFKKQQDVMPKYVAREPLLKGMDDIKAKGVWKDGKWHLEQSRKLDTQQTDDVRFTPDGSVKGAIAVFDHDDNNKHFTSTTLLFKF